MYPSYRDVENWVPIDIVIIHDYGDFEMEIPVVNVLIGTLHLDNNKRTPITRWMTQKTFLSLKEKYRK